MSAKIVGPRGRGPQAKGNVYVAADGRKYFRTPLGGKKRKCDRVPPHLTDDEAAQRAKVLAEIAVTLRDSAAPSVRDMLPDLLERGAVAATEKELMAVRELAERLANGTATVTRQTVASKGTFEAVANAWTSGELARAFPDHIREKRSRKNDVQRLRDHVLPVVRGVHMREFTLDHALRVIASLPDHLSRATRRLIACVINRVVRISIYPLRLLDEKDNPLPRGWMPKVRGSKQQAMPRPSEIDAFVASSEPLALRLLVGFLAREGMRHEEGERLRWADVDLSAGLVRLEQNKTDDARSWALRADVVRALTFWHAMQGKPDGSALVFPNPAGGRLYVKACDYRAALKRAGVERDELHTDGVSTKKTGLHALRGLFVTEALARGKSERWVSDRTGHRSSVMISTYQRRARSFEEAMLTPLGELDALLGWAKAAEAETGNAVASAPEGNRDRNRERPRGRRGRRRSRLAWFLAVGRRGLEPRTYGLKDPPSLRDELRTVASDAPTGQNTGDSDGAATEVVRAVPDNGADVPGSGRRGTWVEGGSKLSDRRRANARQWVGSLNFGADDEEESSSSATVVPLAPRIRRAR